MPKTVNVPESLTRQQYRDLLAVAGFAPEELVSLEFRMDGIHATVVERSPDGSQRYDGGRRATSVVYIPVVDEVTV